MHFFGCLKKSTERIDHTKAAFAHNLFGPTFGEVSGRDMIRLPQNRGQNYLFSGLQMWKGSKDTDCS